MLWSKTLSVIPSESPALQWALEGSHVDDVRDRVVAEDAFTSFGHKYLAAPLEKKKSPASTNGGRMRHAGRAVLILSQRQIQSVRHIFCRDISSSVETPLPMSSRPPPH